MNVAAVVRRLEDGGFTHEHAAILAEVLHDEVSAQIATKDHVDLVVERASDRLEKTIHIKGKSTIKWVAGMIIVQTVALLAGTVGLGKLFM